VADVASTGLKQVGRNEQPAVQHAWADDGGEYMRFLQLLGGCSLMAVAAPVMAQTTEATPPAQAGGQTDDGGSVANEDIIVTASKREQTLQEVPISVSVTPAETIERAQIRDVIDLQTVVPSLRVSQQQNSGATNFIIRGFGNGANNAGIEPSVGVFIDGVYRSRSAAAIGDLPNVKRIEVLRGPQSTLFGKNASAGIISVVTQEPQFEFGGNVEASYGNYNAVILRGIVTGPISDSLAVSIAGNYNKRDGYARYVNLNQDVNDRNRYGVRGQLLFRGSGSLRVRIIGDWDRIDEVCCTVANLFDGPTGNAIRALGGQVNSNRPFSYDSFANFASSNEIENYGGSAQIDFDLLDNVGFTSISAYRAVRTRGNQDSDFTSADLIGNNSGRTAIDTYTQELRLASNFDGPVNFLLGAFLFKEDIEQNTQLLFGRDFRAYANALSGGAYSGNETLLRTLAGLPAATPATRFGAEGIGRAENFNYSNEAYSIFGQLDIEPFDGFTLTGGFNYTIDRKRVSSNNTSTDVFSAIDLVQVGVRAGVPATLATNPAANPFLGLRPLQFLPPFLNFPNAVENGRTRDNDLAYTLRANYEFNDNINVYVTHATGFKASSFNLSVDSRPFPTDFIPGSSAQVPAPAASPIRSAGLAVNNLTTGTRFAGPENAILWEAGLKASYQGFSLNTAIFKQTLKGFQNNIFQGTGFVLGNAEQQSTFGFEADAVLSPSDDLNFTLSYTYLDPKFDSFTGGSAFNPATNGVVPTNLTGQRPTGISQHNIAVGSNYTYEVGDGGQFEFHVDFALQSAFQVAQGLPFKASPESLNASIGYQFSNGLEILVFGRNITQPRFNAIIFPGVAQAGTLSAYPSPPRFYGVTGRFKF
jgi:outer membrane receptor protein involved in Fe transport